MSAQEVRPRRMRYRIGADRWPAIISSTLPRRVLYGAIFFYAAYAAHLYALVRLDPPEPAPIAAATSDSVAPVDSGVLEPLLVRLVQGAGRSGT